MGFSLHAFDTCPFPRLEKIRERRRDGPPKKTTSEGKCEKLYIEGPPASRRRFMSSVASNLPSRTPSVSSSAAAARYLRGTRRALSRDTSPRLRLKAEAVSRLRAREQHTAADRKESMKKSTRRRLVASAPFAGSGLQLAKGLTARAAFGLRHVIERERECERESERARDRQTEARGARHTMARKTRRATVAVLARTVGSSPPSGPAQRARSDAEIAVFARSIGETKKSQHAPSLSSASFFLLTTISSHEGERKILTIRERR